MGLGTNQKLKTASKNEIFSENWDWDCILGSKSKIKNKNKKLKISAKLGLGLHTAYQVPDWQLRA